MIFINHTAMGKKKKDIHTPTDVVQLKSQRTSTEKSVHKAGRINCHSLRSLSGGIFLCESVYRGDKQQRLISNAAVGLPSKQKRKRSILIINS